MSGPFQLAGFLDGLLLLDDLLCELSFSASHLGSLLPDLPPLEAPLFAIGNLAILPFWALMILAPGWRHTERVLRSPLVALAPALGYVALVLPSVDAILPLVMRPELPAIAALLSTPHGAAVAWMHFLAFDLMVGRQLFLDARARGVPAWITSPALFFTLMLGPLGMLLMLGASALFRADRRA